MPNAIYVFERADGREWADYSDEFARRNGRILRTIKADTPEAWAKVVAKETGRVQALAQRALTECRQAPPPPVSAPAPASVKERDLWGRLKWVLTGK